MANDICDLEIFVLIRSAIILCFLAGLIWAAIIAGGWVQSGFGDLNEMRNLIAAFTLMVVGVQICFGGFLLSVAAGNKLKHNAAL